MQVLFIYFSVMILKNVVNSGAEEITDLSDWCTRGRKIDFYLTSGAGDSDAQVSMIASEEYLNCTLIFKVKSGNFVMLVVEFPDQTLEERVCFSQTNNTILIRDYDEKYECQEDGKKAIYYGTSQNSMSVLISSRGLMNTVKLTSTSMRDSNELMCSKQDEFICIHNDTGYCMTSKVLCDEHTNCKPGVDESYENCKEEKMSLIMIMTTIMSGVLSFVLIASAAYASIPNRKEIFILPYDETFSLFDCDDIVTSEILFQELLPVDDVESD